MNITIEFYIVQLVYNCLQKKHENEKNLLINHENEHEEK